MNTTTNRKDWRQVANNSQLLADIERFGGAEQRRVVEQTIFVLEDELTKEAARTPDAFDANTTPESQRQSVERILEEHSSQYLSKVAQELEQRSGYVRPFGLGRVHRSVLTFIGFGLLAIFALTICIPLMLSPIHGGFMWGSIVFISTIAGGVWIYTRVKN